MNIIINLLLLIGDVISQLDSPVESKLVVSEALNNILNVQYTVPIQILKSKLNMLVDIGSSNSWVQKNNIVNPNSDVVKRFDASLGYNEPLVSLLGYKTNITIKGLTSFTVLGAPAQSVDLTTIYDGVLALGPRSDFLIDIQYPSDNQKFGLYLGNYAEGDTSEITFGSYDQSKFSESSIDSFQLVDSPAFLNSWAYESSSVTYTTKVNTTTIKSNVAFGKSFMMPSTITPFVILDEFTARNINTDIGATYDATIGAFKIACPGKNVLKTQVQFNHGTFVYELDSDQFILNYGNGVCVSGFNFVIDDPYPAIILGNVFLRYYYSMYDYNLKRISFSKAKHPKSPSSIVLAKMSIVKLIAEQTKYQVAINQITNKQFRAPELVTQTDRLTQSLVPLLLSVLENLSGNMTVLSGGAESIAGLKLYTPSI
ncbi:aspartic peptidase domain-containing protein, partial [Globomyces pollinis-pini]